MLLRKILRQNTSKGRVAGFVVSNFIGLAIVLGAIQFYADALSIWTEEDSFIKTDYLVVNKKVTSGNTLGSASSSFSEQEISYLEAQPWVRSVGRFTSNDFRVLAGIRNGNRGMSTYMFFESIPDGFVDVPKSQWAWRPGSEEVPIILSKDYLTLYNFGFASSAGLPQLSEGLMSSIPLDLTLTSESGAKTIRMHGRIAGFSNRLNTILVPADFMEYANTELGEGSPREPSRLIIDVSSPGDVAIGKYMEEHALEIGGDKSSSSAAFLLKLVVGIVAAIGCLITLLSLFIMILSISLIMERNRDKLHQLLMLGYPEGSVGRPYVRLVVVATLVASALAVGAIFLLRAFYLEPLSGLGAGGGNVWWMLCAAVVLTGVVLASNLWTVKRRVLKAF